MKRVGPRCLLLLAAACALGRAAVRCGAAGPCFSAHLANASYAEARGACDRRGGGLAWVSGEAELQLLLGLLAEAAAPAPSLFWVGLKRDASACTDARRPLRGFSWEGSDDGAAPREAPAALGRWAKEPVRSCVAERCAGLWVAAGGGPGWGWRERACQRGSRGYACRYRHEGACPDLSPAGALALEYRLPFEERGAGPGFSPPGTVLALACPRGEARLACRPDGGAFAWSGAERPFCPCGRPSAGDERCAGAVGCRDADGRFACAPAPGGPTAAPAAPTAPAGPTAPAAEERDVSEGPPAATAAGEKTGPPPPSSSSSSSNYVFILVTVAVVVLVILVMSVLGVFKLCFDRRPEGRGDKAEAGGADPCQGRVPSAPSLPLASGSAAAETRGGGDVGLG